MPPASPSPRAFLALFASLGVAALLSLPATVSAGVQLIPHGNNSPLGDRWFRTLPNGNIVVADPAFSTVGARNLGAVSLFRPDGTLIQRVEGAREDDALGSGGITVLDNGHYVVSSPSWGGGAFSRAGAVTWGHAEQGLPATISATNSLVGDSSGDEVGGGGVLALGNGHYLVVSRDWGAGTAVSVGAMTWARGDGSTLGPVSSGNSLIGGARGDFGQVDLFRFPNGNAIALLPEWNNGPASNAGALLWLESTAPTIGTLSAANALVGAAADDFRDALLTPTPNGNVVLSAPNWDAPNGANAGAIIVATGSLRRSGTIGSTNAFIGARQNDRLGSGVVHPDYRGVLALANGDLAVISPNFWSNSGAVHRIANAPSSVGVAGVDNMIGGRYANEYVGSGGVVPLSNGGLVVLSPRAWSQPTTRLEAGAVTIAPPGFGRIELSATNSTFGRAADDRWGSGGAIELTDGRVLVGSPGVDDAGLANAGAISVVSASSSGGIDPSNSWFGNTAEAGLGAMDLFRYRPRWAALPNGEALVAVPSYSANGVTRSGVLHVRSDTPRGTIGTNNVVAMPGTPVATLALAGGRFAAVFSEGLAFDVGGRFPSDLETNPARRWSPQSGGTFFRALALSSGRLAVLSSGNTGGSTLSLSSLAPTQTAATVDSSNSLLGLTSCYPHLAEVAGGRFVLFSASGFAMGCSVGTHVLASTSSSLAPTARDWEQAEGDVVEYDADYPSPPAYDQGADRLTFGQLGDVVRMTLDGGNRPPRWTRMPSILPRDVRGPVPGIELRVDAEATDPDGDAIGYAYQWLRTGAPIAGATSSTYRPVAADRGFGISVRVTATARGDAIEATASGPSLDPNRQPTILSFAVTGRAEPGQVLTISGTASDADGDALTMAYEWRRRDGTLLANAASYTVTDADIDQFLIGELAVSDGLAVVRRTQDFWIVGRAPTAVDDRFDATGPMFDIPAPGVLANDSHLPPLDRRRLRLTSIVTSDSDILLTVRSDGSVRGTARRNRAESVTFQYEVCDGDGRDRCGTGRATVTWPAVLVAQADGLRVTRGGPEIRITPIANDIVPEFKEATLSILSSTAVNRLVIEGGTLRFTPSSQHDHEDRIRYRICIPDGRCSEADIDLQHIDGPTRLSAYAARGQRGLWTVRSRDGIDAHVAAYAPVAVESTTTTILMSPAGANPYALPSTDRALSFHPLWRGSAGIATRFHIDSRSPYIVGIDADGDGVAEPAERICSGPSSSSDFLGNGGLESGCDIDGRPYLGTSARFWVLAYRPYFTNSGYSESRQVEVDRYAVDLVETTRAGAWRSETRTGADVLSDISLSWDRSDPPAHSLGYVRYRRRGGPEEWLAYRFDGAIRQAPVAVAPGVPIVIPAESAPHVSESTHFFDVPPGTRRLRIDASARQPFQLLLIPADAAGAAGRSPEVFAGPGPSRAIASASGGPDNAVMEIASPGAGRYFVLPTKTEAETPLVTITATIDATPPTFRPGSYFNPDRSGHGLFVYPSGTQWVGLWYTYRPGGDSTWYYAQSQAPGANGIWRAPLYRSTWKDRRNHLAPAGHLTLTPTGSDRATMVYTLDGITGSEPLVPLGRGCPSLAGAPQDRSGHWFDPARAGTGYSVQLFPNYEFHIAFGYDEGGNADFRVAERAGAPPLSAVLPFESLEGFCPHCERAGAPQRRVAGQLRRTFEPEGRIRFEGEIGAAEQAGGTWRFNDMAIPLGGLQGCAP